LREMEELCRRGPMLAVVAGLERDSAEDDGSAGFTHRPTE
jgi:hypothetical protein